MADEDDDFGPSKDTNAVKPCHLMSDISYGFAGGGSIQRSSREASYSYGHPYLSQSSSLESEQNFADSDRVNRYKRVGL